VARLKASEKENIPLNPAGRPRKLSTRDDLYIARQAATGKSSTATAISHLLKQHAGVDVHRSTVARSLKRGGLDSFSKRKKPLLRVKQRKDIMAFAKRHKHWTIDDWKRVYFSDETKINRYGSDGRSYCWKKRGEPLRDHHVVTTVKHGGGSIMVWGCFSAAGPGYICLIEGNMNAEDYCGILEFDFLDTLEYYGVEVEDVVVQHDNDPKHTAGSTKKWLEDNGIEVLEWPSQSPDLNPIEYLWWVVKHRLKEYQTVPKNNDELWQRVVEIWNGLEADLCLGLVESMPRRIAAVLAAKGGHTKY
jgi:transposase